MKRIICLWLILCLLLTVFVSCGSESNENESIVVEETIDPNAPVPYMDDFEGFEFRVLSRNEQYFKSDDITGEMDGSTLSCATFKRNIMLQEQYNFNIVEFKEDDWVSVAEKVATSGDDVYEMWSFKMNDTAPLAVKGYLYDLNDVEGLNPDAQYYDQLAKEQASVANRLFFLTGDMLYRDDLSAMCFGINMDLWESNNLSDIYDKDIYQLVKDGEWTFASFKKITTTFSHDDGDGLMNDEKDYWGSTFSWAEIIGYNIGMGNELLTKDSNDHLVINQSNKQQSDLGTILEYFSSVGCIRAESDNTIFLSGHSLFLPIQLSAAPSSIKPVLDNYGIVPYPKKDVDQDSYYSFVSTYGANCITIARTVTEVEKVASIIELTSYLSMSTLTPALETYIFEGRVVNRYEDVEMLKLVTSNKKYELCYLWTRSIPLYANVKQMIDSGGAGVSSMLEKNEKLVNANFNIFLKELNKNYK